MTVSLSRRDLLRGSLAVGGLTAFRGFAPRLLTPVHADQLATDRYFLFCYFSGGWDLLLSLDPRDPRVFRDDLKKVTRIQTGFEQLPGDPDVVPTAVPEMTFGPYVGRLAQHADKLTLIRGISMDTLTHEVGRRRFLTGRPPAGLQAQGSSLATILAAHLGTNDPIPQLSVRVESYNDQLPNFASAIRVSSVDDLVRALRPSRYALGAKEQARLDELMESFRACPGTGRSPFRQASVEMRYAAHDLVSLGLGDRFDFGATNAEMEALRDLYGIEPGDLRSPGAQAAAAVTALTAGVARVVSIEVAQGLDHHGPDWSGSHGPRLRDGFDTVAAIIDDLAAREYRDTGTSWLDHTTIVGFSEFGRTAMLNSSGGRDHHLINACFLCGGGVPGGRVIGRSSDVGMAPTELDLVTGASDPGGQILFPEHIFRAILADVGITEDVNDYRVPPLQALYG